MAVAIPGFFALHFAAMRDLLAVLALVSYAVLFSQASCLPKVEFECDSNVDCPEGLCEDVGFCSLFDDGCEFDRRFSEFAPSALASDCVPCPMDGLLIEDGRCYAAFGDDLPWDQAEQACRNFSEGFQLVKIDDAAENRLLADATDRDDSFWIGGNDITEEGRWVWSDGSPIEFSNFDQGEPDNNDDGGEDCVQFRGGTGLWRDDNCFENDNYLCERP